MALINITDLFNSNDTTDGILNQDEIQDNSEAESAEGLSAGEIVAITLGCLFVLLAIVILSLVMRKWKLPKILNRKRKPKKSPKVIASHQNSGLEENEIGVKPDHRSVVRFEIEHADMNTKRSVAAFQKHYKHLAGNQHDLAREYKHLRDWSSKRNKSPCTIGSNTENLWKNRDPRTIPHNRHLVTIIDDANPYAPGQYINASYVDGHYRAKEFITAQLPLETTQDEFWTMIYQEHVHKIISLCSFTEGCEDFTPFWINKGPSAIYKTVRVRMHEVKKGGITTIYKIKIQDIEGNGSVLDCTLVELNLLQEMKLNNIEPLLSLLKDFRKERLELQKRFVPTVLICSNGADFSGAFLAMSMALDQVEEDHVINISGIIRSIRKFRPQFVSSIAQYKLCYDVMAKYLEQRAHITNLPG